MSHVHAVYILHTWVLQGNVCKHSKTLPTKIRCSMIVTTSVHFTSPCWNTYKLCAMQFICPPMTTLQVFYTALKLNVTCKKGQKRPNVAVLVGNSADVAGGVRKGLVRSASYGGGRRIPKHLPKPSPSKRGHYWRKFRVTCCWHLPYSRLCSVNGWRTSPVAWAAVSSAAPLLWGWPTALGPPAGLWF